MFDFVEKTSYKIEMESITSGLIESQKILLIQKLDRIPNKIASSNVRCKVSKKNLFSIDIHLDS